MPNTHSTLTSLFSDIADSIRGKTGSSATIVADDFPTAIANIPTGGGGITTTEVANATGTTLEITSSSGSGEVAYISDFLDAIMKIAWLDANGDLHNSTIVDMDAGITYFEPLIGSVVSCITMTSFTNNHLQEVYKYRPTDPPNIYIYGWLVV